jgi:hypothetical protein
MIKMDAPIGKPKRIREVETSPSIPNTVPQADPVKVPEPEKVPA